MQLFANQEEAGNPNCGLQVSCATALPLKKDPQEIKDVGEQLVDQIGC